MSVQQMINNIPDAIAANATTTTVVTNGGNVFQAGLVHEQSQDTFKSIIPNDQEIGRITAAEMTDDKRAYLLNDRGAVYEYNTDYSSGVSSSFREVYTPVACHKADKAIKIAAGGNHLVILTENNKAWGVGSNDQYQIVPQGNCRYDTAQEIIISNTITHINDQCGTIFNGVINELEKPVIPSKPHRSDTIRCLQDNRCDVLLGYIKYKCVTMSITSQCIEGTLFVPVYGDLSYVGFTCVNGKCVMGNVDWEISRLEIKCGPSRGKFNWEDTCGCHTVTLDISNQCPIVLLNADPCKFSVANSDPCKLGTNGPLKGSIQLRGNCGDCIPANIDIDGCLRLPTVTFDCAAESLLLALDNCRSTLTVLCSGKILGLSQQVNMSIVADFDIKVDCEPEVIVHEEQTLKQPCWVNIAAGFDTTVLIDSCNKIVVLGSIHNLRSNKHLLNDNCLDDLLNKAHTTINLPASALCDKTTNCSCGCNGSGNGKFDLNKVGVSLNFPKSSGQCNENINVCEIIDRLKRCKEQGNANNVAENYCKPCDSYIYLDVNPISSHQNSAIDIGSITIYNKKSVTKLVSTDQCDDVCIPVSRDSIVDFDLNRFCIGSHDIPLYKILKLQFCSTGVNVNLYVDVTNPGGIKFVGASYPHTQIFNISSSDCSNQYTLNYGGIIDPVDLANFKQALSLEPYTRSNKYKNPLRTKLINTYLQGGDYVKFISTNPMNLRHAITADIPTVFNLNKRKINVSVGYNNLIVTGSSNCPNEVFVLGSNCYGELGTGNRESIVYWKSLDKGIFDSQVMSVFSGLTSTFFITANYKVYASGVWRDFTSSTFPTKIESICPTWKIKKIAITKNDIIMLSVDNKLFGFGLNSFGELGLGRRDRVNKPTPIDFFYRKAGGYNSKALQPTSQYNDDRNNSPNHRNQNNQFNNYPNHNQNNNQNNQFNNQNQGYDQRNPSQYNQFNNGPVQASCGFNGNGFGNYNSKVNPRRFI